MLRAYKLIWEILTSSERRSFVFVLFLSILMAFFETIGVAVKLPFLKVLSEPEIIQNNAILCWAYNAIRSETPKDFTVALCIGAFLIIMIGMITRGFVAMIQFAPGSVLSIGMEGGVAVGSGNFTTGAVIAGHYIEPIAPVTLPASGWLLLSALGGFGYIGRRRRTSVQCKLRNSRIL